MITTPSLRTRIAITTAAVVAVSVLALDVFLYVSLSDRLDGVVDEVLAARTQSARQVARLTTNPQQLVDELSEAGIPSVIRLPDGRREQTETTQRLFDELPPSPDAATAPQDRATIVLEDGTEIDVFVSRGGATAILRRVLVLEVIGTVAAIALALVVVNRAARLVTRPVDRIVNTAARIADGETSLRLEPSDPTTEVGRMAAALDRVVAALESALDSARHEEQRSRTFLADAAHQLRTPIAGLRASAETLLTAGSDNQQEQLLEAVVAETERVGRLVDALLAIARLDRPEPLQLAPVDLAEVLHAEVEHQRPLAPTLAIDLDGADHPTPVHGDGTWLRAAVANLLDNARRHAVSRIEVSLRRDGAQRVVTVGDDGPGVAVADRERVFERFMSSQATGSGLGLPIARAVARAHGGGLEVVEAGFELTLPVEATTPGPPLPGATAPGSDTDLATSTG